MMDIVQRKVESIEEEMKPLLQRMEKGDVLAEVMVSIVFCVYVCVCVCVCVYVCVCV